MKRSAISIIGLVGVLCETGMASVTVFCWPMRIPWMGVWEFVDAWSIIFVYASLENSIGGMIDFFFRLIKLGRLIVLLYLYAVNGSRYYWN